MPAARALSDFAIVLYFYRHALGWSQAGLARAAGVPARYLNDLERGVRSLNRDRLEKLLAAMGLPSESLDAALETLNQARFLAQAPHEASDPRVATRRHIESVAAQVGRIATGFVRSSMSLLTLEGEALQERQKAEILWQRLKAHPHAQRMRMVRIGRKFRTWALCEKVARESIAAAANEPAQALELAELALVIAEGVAGEAAWRQRLQGYAGAHVANARRVCNQLPLADQAMTRALKLWEAGADSDPGFLNEAWVPWIEAALRRAQRRFSDALARISEALAQDRGELRGEILITKAGIHDALGDPLASAAALEEAVPLIDPERQPRQALYVRFNLLTDLAQLERYREVEEKLPDVRTLAVRLGGELDLNRLVWLEAKCAAGLKRAAQARAGFEQARQTFLNRGLAFDYALVTLDLSLLLLELGHAAEVSRLAGGMLRVFQEQDVPRETFAAIKVFCDTAKAETATVELARRVVRFLYRAQHSPELRFDSEEGAGEP